LSADATKLISRPRIGPTAVLARVGPTAITVATAALFAVPFGYLIVRVFGVDDAVSLVADGSTRATLWRSLQLALWTTSIAVVVGVGLAWLIVRSDMPARRLLAVAAMLPLVIPSFIGAHAYVSAFAPGGLLEASLGWSNLPEVRALPGAVLVLSALSYPYVMMPVAARLASLPPSWEEGARLLGYSPRRVAWTIVRPQLMSSVVAGGTLVFLYALSDFGAVNFVQYDTLSRKIFEARLDPGRSVLFSLVLGAAALLVTLVSASSLRRLPTFPAASMKRPVVYALGRWKWLCGLCATTVLAVALVIPVGVVTWWVIRGRRSGGRRSAAVQLDSAAWSSAWIATGAAAITVAMVLPMAWVSVRRPNRATSAASVVVSAAFALPGIVIALSMVRLFVGTSLYQSFFVLLFSYALHFGGQALGALNVSIGAVPMRLHEAAQMLGAGRLRRILAIDVRLIVPGLAAGAGLVLLSVLKELPATLMLRPIGFNTLATRIQGTAEEALLIDAGQLSLVLIVLSGALTWLLVVRRRT
jgi:iron(III) transport system permease protein